ncbi:MAG: hypothetical protein AAFV53_13295 [Myxococcota bacterium]
MSLNNPVLLAEYAEGCHVDGLGQCIPGSRLKALLDPRHADRVIFEVLAQTGQEVDAEMLCLYDNVSAADLRKLTAFPALVDVNLYNCDGLTDLSPLADLDGVSTITIDGAPALADLSPLIQMPALEMLWLEQCPSLVDADTIGQLRLTTLSIRRCRKIDDIGFVRGLSALKTLWLNLEHLVDLSPLAALPALEDLSLSDCHSLRDLSPIQSLPTLRTLTLVRLDGALQFGPLAAIPSLVRLTLSGQPHQLDLSTFPPSPGLKSLYITYSAFGRQLDLSPFLALAALRVDASVADGALEVCGVGDAETIEFSSIRILSTLRIQDAANLDTLTIERCEDLEAAHLPPARRLIIGGCARLTSLEMAGGVQKVVLRSDASLALLSALEPNRLEHLELSSLHTIETLPALSRFSRLKTIKIEGCSRLTDASALATVMALETLTIQRCPSLIERTVPQHLR